MNTSKKSASSGRLTWYIGAGIAVLIGIAAIVAIGSSGGNDSSANGLQQFSDITVNGDALAPYSDGADDPAIGMPAPEVVGEGFTGNPVTTKTDAPQLIVFLAHWCPHCNREIPRILELDKQGGIPADLRVVGVATGSRDDQPNWPPSAWLEDMGWKWEAAADSADGQIFSAYGGTSFPTMVLVSPDGTVVNRFSGEIETADLGERIKTFMSLSTGA